MIAALRAMRVGLTLLIAVHAALHMIGFAKIYEPASLPELGSETVVPLSDGSVRAVGLLWLVAAALLFGAAILRTFRGEIWRVVAGAGAALSQALIVLYWADAKAGTIANVVILGAVAVSAATARFKGNVNDEVRRLLARAVRPSSHPVRPFELERLPKPVRRWLIRSGVVGTARTRTVRLKQRGAIRTAPQGAWMPARAEQYFSVDPPAFVWSVDVTMMHALPLVGRDHFVEGKGNMLIEAMGLVRVADAAGDTIDQGSLLRYLAEIVWFPSAALSPHIAWIPIDDSRAKAVMSYGSVTVSAVFCFDERGRFSSLSAERYMGAGRDAKLEEWFVSVSEWRRIEGVEIPVCGNVVWKLRAGDFECYRWEIVELDYDPTTPYPGEVDGASEDAAFGPRLLKPLPGTRGVAASGPGTTVARS